MVAGQPGEAAAWVAARLRTPVDGLVGQGGCAAEHRGTGDPGAEQAGSAQEATTTQLPGSQLGVGDPEVQGRVGSPARALAVGVVVAVAVAVVGSVAHEISSVVGGWRSRCGGQRRRRQPSGAGPRENEGTVNSR